MTTILLFSTSTRENSYNVQLINVIASFIKDAKVNVINLKDYNMPIYDGDIESANGVPENAKRLYDLFAGANGIIISTAEYNASYPPLIKNSVDWVSRIDLKCFHKKPMLIVSASPSMLGGSGAGLMLKNLFMALGAIITPSRFCIASAHNAFNEDGLLKEKGVAANLQQLVDSFVEITKSFT